MAKQKGPKPRQNAKPKVNQDTETVVQLEKLLDLPEMYGLLQDCFQAFVSTASTCSTLSEWKNNSFKYIHTHVVRNYGIVKIDCNGKVEKNEYRDFGNGMKRLASQLHKNPHHEICDRAKVLASQFLEAWEKLDQDLDKVTIAKRLAAIEDKIDELFLWMARPGPFCEALRKLAFQTPEWDLALDAPVVESDPTDNLADSSHLTSERNSPVTQEGALDDSTSIIAEVNAPDDVEDPKDNDAADISNTKGDSSVAGVDFPVTPPQTTVATSPDATSPNDLLDKIKRMEQLDLGRPLAKGGFGSVFRARHKKSKTVVALKAVTTVEEEIRELVKEETKIHRELIHTNVIRMLGEFTNSNGMFVVLEYSQEGDLRHALNQSPNYCFPLWKVAKYVCQVSEGLQYLHSRGIIHRDMKPENLLLFPDHTIKICDFGLAIKAKTRRDEVPTGTPEYMAPEMLEGGKYGCGIDIWALGIVTFEFLTGDVPFQKQDNDFKKSELDLKLVDQFEDPDVQDCIDGLISKLLEISPEKRIRNFAKVSTNAWIGTALDGIN